MSAYAGSFPVVVTQVPQHIAASNSQQVYSSGTDAVSNPNPSAMATPMVYAAGAPGPFPQAAVGSPSGAGSEQGGEEIRTLFVTGFPPDVQMRELHTLLRFFPGYEASQVSSHGVLSQCTCVLEEGLSCFWPTNTLRLCHSPRGPPAACARCGALQIHVLILFLRALRTLGMP